jgi:hypothetical protein
MICLLHLEVRRALILFRFERRNNPSFGATFGQDYDQPSSSAGYADIREYGPCEVSRVKTKNRERSQNPDRQRLPEIPPSLFSLPSPCLPIRNTHPE